MAKRCRLHPSDHDDVCCPEKTIYTNKDQMYNFRWQHKNEQHDIHSKRQFTRLLKGKGLIQTTKDDVLKNGQPYKPAVKTVDKAFVQKTIREVNKLATPENIERHWRKTH